MEEQPLSQLVLRLPSMDDLPGLQLPRGYHARSMRTGAGDEAAWEQIIAASFGRNYSFQTDMAADAAFRPERVWFVCDEDDGPVATASAWYRAEWGENTGYLHMVGLLPRHAGRKLGYYTSLAALLQMRQEGKSQAVLHTDDERLPAIKTYLNLGFVPEFTDSSHPARWQAIDQAFGKTRHP